MRSLFAVATLITLAGRGAGQLAEGARTNAEVNNQQRCVLRRLEVAATGGSVRQTVGRGAFRYASLIPLRGLLEIVRLLKASSIPAGNTHRQVTRLLAPGAGSVVLGAVPGSDR